MPTCWRKSLRLTPDRVMSLPSTITAPDSGTSSKLQQRSKVLLPEPEGPMMNTSLPVGTLRFTPCSTARGP